MKKNKEKAVERTGMDYSIQKYLLKKIISSHKHFIGVQGSIIDCYHIKITGSEMEVCTTDGNRLLKSVIAITNHSGKDFEFNIPQIYMNNLVLLKKTDVEVDFVEITMHETTIEIFDVFSGLKQEFPINFSQYPKYNQLIPDYKKKKFSIALNRKFFNDLMKMNVDCRHNIVEFEMNSKDNLKPVLAKTKSPEIEQFALLMPVQLRG